jgi:hypothetical protein
MKLRTDRLAVSVYARHGDSCSLSPNCKSLGCASGFGPDDYVLSARFAYLQESIDYCQQVAARGVSTRLVSKITETPFVSDYQKREAR